jgi:hypothetical protein
MPKRKKKKSSAAADVFKEVVAEPKAEAASDNDLELGAPVTAAQFGVDVESFIEEVAGSTDEDEDFGEVEHPDSEYAAATFVPAIEAEYNAITQGESDLKTYVTQTENALL